MNVGEIVAAKYKVERLLGKGGMGSVVAARHLQLGHAVAIKILAPELCQNDRAVARFLGEARAAARIRSEHVVRVLDVGTLDDDRSPYMVMELLEGRDLANELERHGNLTIHDAVDYILQSCEALAEAHAIGIVHRDLKPANLFRIDRPDGAPLIKLLDFGIAKALVPEGQGESVSITATQGLVGSPRYMSPEQVRRPKAVDTRSDIWSLGVILHEFLAGTPPFVADTEMSILAAVVSDEPASLRDARLDVPAELEAVVRKCLGKDPDERYQDVVELAFALQPFAFETGHAAYDRISAILHPQGRTIRNIPSPRPWPTDAPTLESGGVKPGGGAVMQPAPPDSASQPGVIASWGKSHGGTPSSRRRPTGNPTGNSPGRRVALTAGVVAALGLGALALYPYRAKPTAESLAPRGSFAGSAGEVRPPNGPSVPTLPIPGAVGAAPPADATASASTHPVASAAPAASTTPVASAPTSVPGGAKGHAPGANPAAKHPGRTDEKPLLPESDDPLSGRH